VVLVCVGVVVVLRVVVGVVVVVGVLAVVVVVRFHFFFSSAPHTSTHACAS